MLIDSSCSVSEENLISILCSVVSHLRVHISILLFHPTYFQRIDFKNCKNNIPFRISIVPNSIIICAIKIGFFRNVHIPSRTHPFAGRTRMRGWRGSGCRPRRSATDAPASAGRASASMETANRRHRAGRRGCRRRPRCPIGRLPGRRCSTPTRRQQASSGAGAAAAGGGAATSTGRTHRRHRSRPDIGPRSATTSSPICKFENRFKKNPLPLSYSIFRGIGSDESW